MMKWVHHNVSVGNILSCGGIAKLANPECGKKVGDVKSHEMWTASGSSINWSGKPLTIPQQGTMHFMLLEVAVQKFLFQPHFDKDVNITDFMQDIQSTSGIQNSTITVPFYHNHLNDLESLWWVAVWLVFYNCFSKAQGSDGEHLFKCTDAEHQLKLAQIILPSILKNTDCQDGLEILFQDRNVGLPCNKAVICGDLNNL
jgi:hypothetical protein